VTTAFVPIAARSRATAISTACSEPAWPDGNAPNGLRHVVAGADLRLVGHAHLDAGTAADRKDQLLGVVGQGEPAAHHGSQHAVRRRVATSRSHSRASALAASRPSSPPPMTTPLVATSLAVLIASRSSIVR